MSLCDDEQARQFNRETTLKPENMIYDDSCKKCSRLADFLKQVKNKHPDYFCKPVAPFGDNNNKLLIVGLAPGMHGANATGRPFTGDHAGILLYQTLFDFGFASKNESISASDGLKLINCKITNAVKCLPPGNKPVGAEVNECNAYLSNELNQLKSGSIVLSLGLLSHKAVIKALGLKQSDFKFTHGASYKLNSKLSLVDSYHCSRYNTNTKRLTEQMFRDVFQKITTKLEKCPD